MQTQTLAHAIARFCAIKEYSYVESRHSNEKGHVFQDRNWNKVFFSEETILKYVKDIISDR